MAGKHRLALSAHRATSAGFGPRAPLVLAVVCLLFILLVFFLLPPAQPALAQDARWVLTETVINPNNEKLEFRGGGSTPGYYSEPRYEGKYHLYAVTETSFALEDRWVDSGEEWYHVTFHSSFEAPPKVLIPGETYPLRMGFSHSGSVKRGNPYMGFRYISPNVAIGTETPLADNTLWHSPWAEVPSTVSSMTWLLRPPPTSQAGSTLEIYAQWWNAPACVVKWVYRSEIGAPTTTKTSVSPTTQAQTSTSTSAADRPSTSASTPQTGETAVGPRTFTDGEFEKAKAEVRSTLDPTGSTGYIGVVIAAMGDWEIFDYRGRPVRAERQLGPAGSVGHLVRIGDTIRTSGRGRVRVEMADRDDSRDVGPSVINCSVDTELSFTSFRDPFASDGIDTSSMITLIKGSVRAIFQGWRGEAALSIRTGVVICGIRGSDVLILHDPAVDMVLASVHEGLMDVTSTVTAEGVSLTDGQSMVVAGGNVVSVLPMTQEDWDEMVAFHGLEDMQPLSAKDRDRVLQTSAQPLAPAQVEQTGVGSGMLALIVVAALIAGAAVGAGIYLLVRSRGRSGGRTPAPADAPAASAAFCRHCGSAVTPGSDFCMRCGRKL